MWNIKSVSACDTKSRKTTELIVHLKFSIDSPERKVCWDFKENVALFFLVPFSFCCFIQAGFSWRCVVMILLLRPAVMRKVNKSTTLGTISIPVDNCFYIIYYSAYQFFPSHPPPMLSIHIFLCIICVYVYKLLFFKMNL